MRIVLLASLTLLAACGLKTLDGQDPPQDLMSVVSTTKFSMNTSISIVRDQRSKCDYISIDGDRLGAFQPRLRGRQAVCDGTRAAGFEIIAKSDTPRASLYRLRDVGTGCQWLFAEANQRGDLTPALTGDGGQVCQARTPGAAA